MRIAFVEPTVTRTFGSTRRIVELANALAGLAHDVTVFSRDGRPPQWIRLRVPVEQWLGIRNARPFDLALFNNSKLEELQLVMDARARVRAFYVLGWGETRLDEIEAEIKLGGALGPQLQTVRHVFEDPDLLVLACSTWIGDHLRDRYRSDVETLLGGINREHFRPWPKPCSGSTVSIYSSGDPRRRKGSDTVEKAISAVIRRSRPPFICIHDTYWGKGISQVKMGQWYSQATIFADGQHWAGWNNPVLEAMACRTPVVCTDIGGVRDFAIDGETALLVPPRDAGAMADALVRLIQSEELRDRLAGAAYEHVRRFTWEETAARLIELVRERS